MLLLLIFVVCLTKSEYHFLFGDFLEGSLCDVSKESNVLIFSKRGRDSNNFSKEFRKLGYFEPDGTKFFSSDCNFDGHTIGTNDLTSKFSTNERVSGKFIVTYTDFDELEEIEKVLPNHYSGFLHIKAENNERRAVIEEDYYEDYTDDEPVDETIVYTMFIDSNYAAMSGFSLFFFLVCGLYIYFMARLSVAPHIHDALETDDEKKKRD